MIKRAIPCRVCGALIVLSGRPGRPHETCKACQVAVKCPTAAEHWDTEPSVYVLHFPLLDAGKVGFTTFRDGASGKCRTKYICSGRQNAKRMFGSNGDYAESVWLKHGDVRHEAYIQACLSFCYAQPEAPSRGGRCYEWFFLKGTPLTDFLASVDVFYAEAIARQGR